MLILELQKHKLNYFCILIFFAVLEDKGHIRFWELTIFLTVVGYGNLENLLKLLFWGLILDVFIQFFIEAMH